MTSNLAGPTSDLDRTMEKLWTKTTQLKTKGLTSEDRHVLRLRLNLAWNENIAGPVTTRWRKNAASKVYKDLQDASHHLFLAGLLTIPPTDCIKPFFKGFKQRILSLDSYEDYKIILDSSERVFFDTIAATQGFSDNARYLDFVHSMFPKEDRSKGRAINYAYSGMPTENIDTFLTMLREAIVTSNTWKEERARGEKVTCCVTTLVPDGDKDVCFQIIGARKSGLSSVGDCDFKTFMLE